MCWWCSEAEVLPLRVCGSDLKRPTHFPQYKLFSCSCLVIFILHFPLDHALHKGCNREDSFHVACSISLLYLRAKTTLSYRQMCAHMCRSHVQQKSCTKSRDQRRAENPLCGKSVLQLDVFIETVYIDLLQVCVFPCNFTNVTQPTQVCVRSNNFTAHLHLHVFRSSLHILHLSIQIPHLQYIYSKSPCLWKYTGCYITYQDF